MSRQRGLSGASLSSFRVKDPDAPEASSEQREADTSRAATSQPVAPATRVEPLATEPMRRPTVGRRKKKPTYSLSPEVADLVDELANRIHHRVTGKRLKTASAVVEYALREFLSALPEAQGRLRP